MEALELAYKHPWATFFFLLVIAGIVGNFRPFAKGCDCDEEK